MSSSQWRANGASFAGSLLISSTDGLYHLTPEGLGDPDVAAAIAQRPSDPLERWVAAFSPAIGAMLRAIVAAGEPLSKFEVASAAGVSPTSSTVGTGLRELRINGLIQETNEGRVPIGPVAGS
jgi:hypothetical protein